MIKRISIRDFRGIKAKEYVLASGGVLVEGTNASGKTSFVSAIRAALVARGIDETAVRIGAEEAEILVDLDHATVRRLVKANGSTSLSITKDDGTKQGSPQAWLNDLLGIAPLDPIDLIEEKDATKRRAKILAAMPIAVSPDVLVQWLPSGDRISAEECKGHGLDVVERLRKAVYERRAEANRIHKGAAIAVQDQSIRVATAEAELGPEPVREHKLVDAEMNAAVREQLALESRIELAQKQTAQADRTRGRVADLRTKAQIARADAQKIAPAAGAIDKLNEARAAEQMAIDYAETEVQRLREELREATARAELYTTRRAAIDVQIDRLAKDEADAQALVEKATEHGSQADELEATIASAEAPSIDALAAAREKVIRLRQELERTARGAKVAEARVKLEAAKAEEAAAKAKAWALDKSEKALKHDAPKALLAASGGVPGLTVDGDTIRLDGVALDTLSGAEQLRFAVDIARRMNAKSKLLVIDRLEAVAPDQLEDFIAHATADGYQLIATRVAEGPIVAKPIGGAT